MQFNGAFGEKMMCGKKTAAELIRPSSWRYLLDPNFESRVFALTVLRILIAYRTGCLRYAVFAGTKPPP